MKNPLREPVELFRPGTVFYFEGIKKQQNLFDSLQREFFIVVQRMGNKMNYVILPEVGNKLIDTFSEIHNVFKKLLIDIKNNNMQTATVFREIGRDFRTDKRSREVRYFQRSLDVV